MPRGEEPHPYAVAFHRCWTWKTLPAAGGILEQNPMVMDMFDVFISEVNKAEKAEMEKARKKRK